MTYTIEQGLFKYEIVDYHAILGVPLEATPQMVRTRYLTIAQRLHPDTCKDEGIEAKEQASQLLSKLVNPAYENLGKARYRADHLLLLSQMGKTLAGEREKIPLTSELANQLDRETANIDLAYRKLLQSIVGEQYKDLNTVLQKIGQISELNLVYLRKMGGARFQQKEKSQLPLKATTDSPEQSSQAAEKISPILSYIRRAREAIEKKLWTTALLELRDAVKLDPSDSTAQSLLGLTYLKQNQIKMAKLHIDKAYQLDPKNPDVIEAKRLLDKVTKKNPPEESSGGFLGKLFGGRKDK